MSQLTARISTKYADPSGQDPDLQIFFAGYLAKCSKTGEAKALEDPQNPNKPKHLTISPVTLHPRSRGAISLKSNNPLDPPSIKVNYLKDPQDMATLIEGVRIIQRLANTTVLKKMYGIEMIRDEYGNCGKQHRSVEFSFSRFFSKFQYHFLTSILILKVTYELTFSIYFKVRLRCFLGLRNQVIYRSRKSSSRILQDGTINRSHGCRRSSVTSPWYLWLESHGCFNHAFFGIRKYTRDMCDDSREGSTIHQRQIRS